MSDLSDLSYVYRFCLMCIVLCIVYCFCLMCIVFVLCVLFLSYVYCVCLMCIVFDRYSVVPQKGGYLNK